MLIFGVMALSSVLGNNAQPLPHHNLVDTQISQYSDKHITMNAIATDPQFKNIAFAPNDSTRPSFFANQIAAVVKSLKSFMTPSVKKELSTKEYGSWIWTPIMSMSQNYMESVLSDAKVNGVNTIYISVDTYLDIFVMEKGVEKERQKKAYGDKLEDFIIRANKKGLSVDAEAGWRNWAEDENEYKAFAVVNYVKNFNETHQNKFRGFQYDVEPYLLKEYKKDPAAVLKKFVALIDKTEKFISKSPLKFSVVIPDFYDEKDGVVPKFSYNNKKLSVFEHLLDILERKPANSVIVMSYRSFANGYDGSIEVSENEMQTASQGAYQTKIIIAQETGDVPPPYITFYKTSKKYLGEQIERINTTFGSNPNFGGIAIHYVNAFLALK